MLLATLVFLFGRCWQFWLGAQHYFEATTRWCVRRLGTVPDPWLILRGQQGICTSTSSRKAHGCWIIQNSLRHVG